MYQIDRSAHTNGLAATRAEHKVATALLLLAACLLFDRISAALLVASVIGGLTVGVARVPPRLWARVTLTEFSFLLLSIGGVVVVILPAGMQQGIGLFMADGWIGVTGESVHNAARLLTRSLGAVSCLTFIAFTTPLHQLIALCRRVHVPALLIDLALLMYRFLWAALATLAQMQTAQSARLGNATWASTLRSAGMIGARLFVHTYQRVSRLNDAWAARNFNGDLPVLLEPNGHEAPQLILIGLAAVLSMAVLWWVGVP